MPAEMGLAKTHILENCDLPTLLEPAPAHAVQVIRGLPRRFPCVGESRQAQALRCAKMTLEPDMARLAPLKCGAMPGWIFSRTLVLNHHARIAGSVQDRLHPRAGLPRR